MYEVDADGERYSKAFDRFEYALRDAISFIEDKGHRYDVVKVFRQEQDGTETMVARIMHPFWGSKLVWLPNNGDF